MKAVFHDTYGSEGVLTFREVSHPIPGDDEVVVRVRAAGVNRGDALAVAGIPYAARLGYGLTGPKQTVPGTDVAGVVESVGAGVGDLEPGDEVVGWSSGAFAEHSLASAASLTAKPAQLTFEQAAAAPTPGVAALQGLREVGAVRSGHRVLVVGASGGVGTFAVQIAKTFGAEVTGVCSTRNIELVRSAGADRVIDYTREDFTQDAGRYDLILDLVGKESLSSSRRALAPTGTYVVVAGGNPRSITGMGRFAEAVLRSPLGRQRLRPLFSKQAPEDLEALVGLLAEGRVLPVIDAVYDLRDASEALRYISTGHARGRVVLTTGSTTDP